MSKLISQLWYKQPNMIPLELHLLIVTISGAFSTLSVFVSDKLFFSIEYLIVLFFALCLDFTLSKFVNYKLTNTFDRIKGREVLIFIMDYFIYCSFLAFCFWAAKLNTIYIYLPNTAYGVILGHCLVNILNTMVKGNMLSKNGYDFITNVIKVFIIKSANVQKIDKNLVGFEPDDVRNSETIPNIPILPDINQQNNLNIKPNEEKS